MASAEYRIPWVTITLQSTDKEVVQLQDEWMDTEGFTSGSLMVQCPVLSTDLTCYFETAQKVEGPWRTIWELTNANCPSENDEYAETMYLTSAPDASDSNRFDRYIRWRVVSNDYNTYFCFRAAAFFRS